MLWSQTDVVLSTKDRLDWEAPSHDRDFPWGPEKPGAAQPVGRQKVPEVKTLRASRGLDLSQVFL